MSRSELRRTLHATVQGAAAQVEPGGSKGAKNLFMSEAVTFLQARAEIQYKKSNCFSTALMVVKEVCSMMPPFYKEGFISSCEFWETSLTLVKFANI